MTAAAKRPHQAGTVLEAIDLLADCNTVEYEGYRKLIADEWGWRMSKLDAAVAAKRKEKANGKTNGANGPAAAVADWLKDCQLDKGGQVLGNLANALMALRADPAWKGILVYDEMRRAVVLQQPMPEVGEVASQTADATIDRPMADADVTAAQEWLQLSGIAKLGKDTAHQAVDLYARETPRHPIREWLAALTWDGNDRIGTWLHDYIGADNTDYVSAIGRMFLVSMVARVMAPGCKADHMLVLEGDQGTLKSTACKVLAGGEFFSDSMPEDVGGKDAALHLRGKWLVEMAEMHALSRSETTALKAFLTRDTDIYRPPYGRLEVYEKRQSVFIGTTNKSEYLKDETGGRRFWPVKCGTIRPDALAAARDQLFAEALDAYRAGQPWWPDAAFEREYIQPQQAARYVTDVWQQLVENYLKHEQRVTVLQVAREALELKTDKIGTADQRRISAVLEAAGWKRGPRTLTARWWIPGHDA